MKNSTVEELVLDAAEKLFGRYGLEKTSMDDIAKTVRKSKRSLYNYFSGKEEIFAKVLQREINTIKSKTNEYFNANKDKHPLAQLKVYLLSRPDAIKNAIIFCQVLKNRFQENAQILPSSVNEMVQEFNHWEHSLFEKIVNSKRQSVTVAIEKKDFAVSFADMIQMAIQGLNFAFFVEDKYVQYKAPYDQLLSIIIDSLGKNEQIIEYLDEKINWK